MAVCSASFILHPFHRHSSLILRPPFSPVKNLVQRFSFTKTLGHQTKLLIPIVLFANRLSPDFHR